MELNILDHRLWVCSIKKQKIQQYMHVIIKHGLLNSNKRTFFSLVETCEDFTVILTEEAYAELPPDPDRRVSAQAWVPLSVSLGAYSVTKMAGIAKTMIIPLADSNVSIFSLSTYQTDYILVQEVDVDRVTSCLSSKSRLEGHRHSFGNTLPLDRISLDTEEVAKKERPVTHQFTTPINRFHITSTDPDNIHMIGMTLIKMWFYPSLDTDCVMEGCERFLSFSVIDGDVSLVIDEKDLPKFPADIMFAENDPWRMIKIRDIEDGLGFAECGIVAQISDPIADANISEYYISTFFSDYTLVPESTLENVYNLLSSRQVLESEMTT